MTQKIFLSRDDKIIAGVCGGIAKNFKVDPLWPRLAAVLLALWGGVGIVLYLVAWLILEEEPKAEAPSKKAVKKSVKKAAPKKKK